MDKTREEFDAWILSVIQGWDNTEFNAYTMALKTWEYQQKKIDELSEQLRDKKESKK